MYVRLHSSVNLLRTCYVLYDNRKAGVLVCVASVFPEVFRETKSFVRWEVNEMPLNQTIN